MEETAYNISNPERIERILRTVAASKTYVRIKSAVQSRTVVKGQVEKHSDQALTIGNISERGRDFLSDQHVLDIEFVGISTRLSFKTRTMRLGLTQVQVEIPRL